jgi:hypothetical protein
MKYLKNGKKSELISNLECENVPTPILFCYNKINNMYHFNKCSHVLSCTIFFSIFVTPNLTLRWWDNNNQFKQKSE